MTIPTTPVRGDVYYFMDGSYGGYTLTGTTANGATIEFRKAQTYDFGRASDGCSNDISAGWNPSTMGSAQANFDYIEAQDAGFSNWKVNGNGQSTYGCELAPSAGAAAKDCGFKFTTIPTAGGVMDIGANNSGSQRSSNITLTYIETQGLGDNPANGKGEETIWCHGGCDNFIFTHNYAHDSGTDFFKIPWSSGMTVANNYIFKNFSNSDFHGQMFLMEGVGTNLEFRSNYIGEIQGTAIWSIVTSGNGQFDIHNNVIFRQSGSSRPGTSNALIACINGTSTCTVNFNQNSIVNYVPDPVTGQGMGVHCDGKPITVTWRNNLFYLSPGAANPIAIDSCGGTVTTDHNTYLQVGTPNPVGTRDVVIASDAPNPFTNWTKGDYRLASRNVYWTNGTTLGSRYAADFAGNARPSLDSVWDRGAFQFRGTPSCAITTTSLPVATVGTAYNQILASTNCTGEWTLSSGSLPANLSLDGATGAITGTPSAAGTSSFSVSISTATQPLSIVVSAATAAASPAARR